MHSIYLLYDRNLAVKILYFEENHEHTEDFLRYVVHMTRINPIKDIKQTPLLPLEDLARGAPMQLEAGVT
jgi:hypothetical protein